MQCVMLGEGLSLSQVNIDDSASQEPQSAALESAVRDAPKEPEIQPRKQRTPPRVASRSKAGPEEARIRELLNGTGDFDFTTLIAGVSTINQPSVQAASHRPSQLPTPG